MNSLAPSHMGPPAQPRKPSGARPAPSAQIGPPVRAEYFNPPTPAQHRPAPAHSYSEPQHPGPTRKAFMPNMEHRPSMPSPKSTVIEAARYQARGSPSVGSSLSSRPSPHLSSHSEDSLRETTRHNIQPYRSYAEPERNAVRGQLPAARQASANLLWGEEVKSPKSPEVTTPRDSYIERAPQRDEVDIHFDNLMVCPRPGIQELMAGLASSPSVSPRKVCDRLASCQILYPVLDRLVQSYYPRSSWSASADAETRQTPLDPAIAQSQVVLFPRRRLW